MLKIQRKNVENIISVAICLFIVMAFGIWGKDTEKEKIRDKDIQQELERNDSVGMISVYVGGEVMKEGTYKFKKGSRVGDAIEAAGGFTEDANRNINIAFILRDGGKVIVSDKSQPANAGIDFRININTASKEELCILEGVGEKTADKIINYRENVKKFSSVEEIMEVKGIGEKIYNGIKNEIVVE